MTRSCKLLPLLCAAAALSLPGCDAPQDATLRDAECDAEACDVDSPTSEVVTRRQRLEGARLHFVRTELAAYRMLSFDLLSDARGYGDAEVLLALEEVIAVVNEGGADGLEPYILLLVDMAAEGEEAVSGEATAILGGLDISYNHETPAAGMLQSLASVTTRMQLDIRPGVARALLGGLVDEGAALSLRDLLEVVSVREDICGLPGLQTSEMVTEEMVEMDGRRSEACEQLGAGGAGGMPDGLLGGAGLGGCIDTNLDNYRTNDEYDIADRAADLDECMGDIDEYFGGQRRTSPTSGGTLVVKKLLENISVDVTADLTAPVTENVRGFWTSVDSLIDNGGELGRVVVAGYIDHLKTEAANAAGLDAQIVDAAADAAGAYVGLKDATTSLENARGAYNTAQQNVRSAEEAYHAAKRAQCLSGCSEAEQKRDQREIDDAKEDLDRARQKESEAKKDLDEAKKDYKDANKEAARARARLDELKKQKDAGDPSEMDDFNSPACNRLLGGGRDFTDPVDMHQLPENWAEGPWRDPVINPNPEEDPVAPSSAMGLSACGEDPATRRGSMSCGSLMLCDDPGAQCGCNDDPSTIEANAQAFANEAAVTSCYTVMCAEGEEPVPSGFMCECGGNEGSGDAPRPRPLPIATAMLTEAGEMVGTEAHGQMATQDPLSLLVMDSLRP